MDTRVAVLADQVSAVLPGPPPVHDAFGYLAWEELVLSAAQRLAFAAGEHLHGHPFSPMQLDAVTERLTSMSLLALAALLASGSDPRSCELALAQAVDACRASQRALGAGACGHRFPRLCATMPSTLPAAN